MGFRVLVGDPISESPRLGPDNSSHVTYVADVNDTSVFPRQYILWRILQPSPDKSASRNVGILEGKNEPHAHLKHMQSLGVNAEDGIASAIELDSKRTCQLDLQATAVVDGKFCACHRL